MLECRGTEIEDLLTEKIPCSWEVVEDFSDANTPFSNREIPMQWINANHREGKWCRAITTYKFEMHTAGVHRVWLRKLILQKYVYVAYGFYQVSVPLYFSVSFDRLDVSWNIASIARDKAAAK